MGKNKLPRLVQGRKPKQMTDPAKKYANSVLNGDIVACKWVKLACQRHLDDLEHGHKRGLVWRPDKAARVVRFFRNKLILWKGRESRLVCMVAEKTKKLTKKPKFLPNNFKND
jgi:phage terminase large subunit-like protein